MDADKRKTLVLALVAAVVGSPLLLCGGCVFLGMLLRLAGVEPPPDRPPPEISQKIEVAPEITVEPVAVPQMPTPPTPRSNSAAPPFVFSFSEEAILVMKESNKDIVGASVRQEGEILYLSLEVDSDTGEERARDLCGAFISVTRVMSLAHGGHLIYVAEARAGDQRLAGVKTIPGQREFVSW